MPQVHSSRQAFVILFAVAALSTFSYILLKNFQSLTGALVTSVNIGGNSFVVATEVQHDDAIAIPAGQHGIVTCPSTEPAVGMRWATPADYAALSGIKIYQFSAGYASEKQGTWSGMRYGYGQSAGATLATLSASQTYYIRANEAVSFRCTMAVTASSSSSSQFTGIVPVAYWPLEEGPNGRVVTDVIGGKNATASGTITWGNALAATGALNSAWGLNLSGGYLRASGTGVLNFDIGDRFSISAWTRHDGRTTDTIITKFGGSLQGYSLNISQNGTVGFFLADGQSGFGISLQTSQRVGTGVYTHILASYDGTLPPTERLRIYINGVRDPAQAIYTPPSISGVTPTIRTANSSFDIGRALGIFGNNTSAWFNGDIDDVRVYNQIVTPDDIAGAPRFNDIPAFSPEPQAHYTLDVGQTHTSDFAATDSTPTGAALVFYIANNTPANDLNGDGRADIGDLGAIMQASGLVSGQSGFSPSYDRDNNGRVDFADISLFNTALQARPANSTTDANGQLTWTPAANQAGVYNFTVSTFDPTYLGLPLRAFHYASRPFTLTVLNQIGYWPIEENGGTVMTDLLYGRNGSYSGAVQWVPSTVPGSSYALNTLTVTGAAVLPNIPELAFSYTSPFSVSFWMRKTPSATPLPFLVSDSLGIGPGWIIGSFSGSNIGMALNINRATAQTTHDALTTNSFSHYLLTYDGKGTGTGVSIYVNGIKQPTATSFNSTFSSNMTNAVPISFGKYSEGYIYDDIRIFRGVVLPQDIPNAPGSGGGQSSSMSSTQSSIGGLLPSLVAYWPFEDGTGTSATEVISGHDALAVGSATWTTDVPSALGFSSHAIRVSGGFFRAPHSGTYDFESTQPFTVSLWYKNEGTSTGALLGKFTSTDPLAFKGWQLHITQNNRISFLLSDKLFDAQVQQSQAFVTTTASFTPNQFHNVVASYNGSRLASGIKIYVDGVEQTSRVVEVDNLGSETMRHTDPLEIGASGGLPGFTGILDDVRIYNEVLTPAEISS